MEENNKIPGKGAATASLVLGIISVACLFFSYAIISIPTAIAGLICAGNSKKAGFASGVRTAGFVLSLIGLIIGIVELIACIALAGVLGSAIASEIDFSTYM